MVRLTKAQAKQRERVEAWINGIPFKENARDKNPQVPQFTLEQLLEGYVPQDISGGAKFYTPLQMADDLFENFRQVFPIRRDAMVLEPCAGIGSLLYPLYNYVFDDHSGDNVFAVELDKEAYEIGKRLFPSVNWINKSFYECDFSGMFDLVYMNPPFNILWATYEAAEVCSSGATSSEHYFLERAIHSLNKGGYALIIAPFNYLDKMPKAMKAWANNNFEVVRKFGQLEGVFQFTGVKVNGFLLQRVSEPEYTRPNAKPGDERPIPAAFQEMVNNAMQHKAEREAPDETPDDTQDLREVVPVVALYDGPGTGQAEFDLLPDAPPEPDFEAEVSVDGLLNRLDVPFRPFIDPDKDFLRSVRKWGVRDPLILTYVNGSKETLKLRDGRRRLQAAIHCNLPLIKVRIYTLGDYAGAALTLDSNTQRSSNPIAEYHAIMEMIQDAKRQDIPITEHDIHAATGMDTGTIRKRMKLAATPPQILKAVEQGKTIISVAYAAATMQPEYQRRLVELLQANGKLVYDDLRRVRMVQQASAADQIPMDAFNTPGVSRHVHDFSPTEAGLRCLRCGHFIAMRSALDFLNIYWEG